jgi:hypothetical protein
VPLFSSLYLPSMDLLRWIRHQHSGHPLQDTKIRRFKRSPIRTEVPHRTTCSLNGSWLLHVASGSLPTECRA